MTAYGFPLGFRPENVRVYEEKATTLCNGTRPGFTTGIVQECWTLDEKMGNTYCHKEQANTLAQRGYKQPQAVIYEVEKPTEGVE